MTTITGRQIRDGTVTGDDIQDGSLELKDLSDDAKSALVAAVLSQLAPVAISGNRADLVGAPKLGLDPSD
jgi:hypothetical protein